jgi:hypothetical protein
MEWGAKRDSGHLPRYTHKDEIGYGRFLGFSEHTKSEHYFVSSHLSLLMAVSADL